MWKFHKWFEKHTLFLLIGILVVVSIGGLVQITPLFFIESTIERVQGVRPYTPLELAGRQVYIREGCYTCHSQMIRPLRDEVERYGHYSLAAESMYDHPFQWGSKRTGPDLARVGGRYSDEWHRAHLVDPRSVVPESVMPPYAFLARADLDTEHMQNHLQANAALRVPYTAEQIANANADARAQAEPMGEGAYEFEQRYPGVALRDFDGDPKRLTEMDALIAYLQMLGAGVDFSTYQAEALKTNGEAAMTYEQATHLAQTWGLIILALLFAGASLYALWPANREKFDRAARAPLMNEDDDGR